MSDPSEGTRDRDAQEPASMPSVTPEVPIDSSNESDEATYQACAL